LGCLTTSEATTVFSGHTDVETDVTERMWKNESKIRLMRRILKFNTDDEWCLQLVTDHGSRGRKRGEAAEDI